jgi:hypothetical protein
MSAVETQPDVVIWHGLVEAELRRLVIGQQTCLWGRVVWRQSACCWCIDGGPSSSLLVAIDSLMCKRRILYDGTEESTRDGNSR